MNREMQKALESDGEKLRQLTGEDHGPWDVDDTCPTCNGRGTVNPLTAPKDFFCVGTTDCPSCDGQGYL